MIKLVPKGFVILVIIVIPVENIMIRNMVLSCVPFENWSSLNSVKSSAVVFGTKCCTSVCTWIITQVEHISGNPIMSRIHFLYHALCEQCFPISFSPSEVGEQYFPAV